MTGFTDHCKKLTSDTWVTRDGRHIAVPDMATSHLFYTVRLLRGWGLAEKFTEELSCAMSARRARGEYAQMAVEQEADALASMTVEEYLAVRVPCWRALRAELKKRRGEQV